MNADVKDIVTDPLAKTPAEPKGFIKQARRTVYVTSDGAEYTHRQDAVQAQRIINVGEFVSKFGTYGKLEVSDIIDHWGELKKAMGV